NTVANVILRTPLLSFTPTGLSEATGGFNSSYNALQFSVKKQYSRDLTFLGAYTWSHGLDNLRASGSGRNQPTGGFTGDFRNRRANRGSTDFDRTHRVILSYVWNLPALRTGNRVLQGILGKWSFSGVTTMQSGTPFP